jgi:acetyl esterase
MPTVQSHSQGTRPSFAFDVEDLEYVRHGDKPLLLRLYKPRGEGPFPLMIDLHGGAWCSGDRTNDVLFSEALAKSGVAVAALDFRMPPEAAYPASVADINYAIRWLKGNAKRLGLKGERVGLIGISSGGHQAMLAAMRPADPRYTAIPYRDNPALDAKAACAVLVWPVIDPLGRYHHAQRLTAAGGTYPPQLDTVIPAHLKFWGDEAGMDEGSPVRALERGEAAELPPVLYVQGANDVVHPRADLERFVAVYAKRGGKCDLALYDGEAEGFIRNPASRAGPVAVQRIIDFALSELG